MTNAPTAVTKPLAHSYSSLKQFDNCPKQYYMQRISREVKQLPGEASMYGERIHEQFENRLQKHTQLPEESAQYERLCKAWEDMPGELFGEQELTLNKNLQPTGWWDDDAWLRAKLDTLVLNGELAVVGDWKTGKHRPDFSQLALFALQTFKHYPDVNKVQAAFVWLKTEQIDTRTYTRADEPELWEALLGRIARIEHALEQNNWPVRPSGLCPWCPAKHLCRYANL